MDAGRRIDHAPFRDERRLEKSGIDSIEIRVAVGAVHRRLILRAKAEWVAADFDREIGCFCLAVDDDPLEDPAETAASRQDAADAVEDAQIGAGERERPVERRPSGLLPLPRAEGAGGGDFAGWHAVGQRRVERHRLASADVAEAERMNRPDSRRPVLLFRIDDHLRAARVEGVDDRALVAVGFTGALIRA